ncbi:sporulation membrane protein YtaF [Sediminibacillus dalangtanensis]|uniref:Sporulation membrane protein YtaF n=1 Tax=Sediminibacillus dalangtanensis TaxID=2729421 RepID=A0ABX7VVJ7_9BACI|nr:sporulation membrane protein YtaF [Sediminibacillus dalangtanensis]QTN00045.1 sporulation membrane protein YtaF [Sediminibacillus dalangtanensis]
MADISTFVLLAFAVSLDSFMVGFTYGLRKMAIRPRTILLIAIITAVVFYISMLIGSVIASFLDPSVAEMIGGTVLILIGIWVVYQFFRTDNTQPEQPIVLKFEIKSLGIVIEILKKPMAADFDKSGNITGIEALLLGLALSVDSFGAGIGAAMLGFPPLLAACGIGATTGIFLTGGLKSGYLFSYWRWLQQLTFLPGLILIVIGIIKIT